MDFPMRVPFKLGKVKNSDDWDEYTKSQFLNLVTLLNTYGGNKISEQELTPLNSEITLTSEYNIAYVESKIPPQILNVNLIIDTEIKKRMYYLIVNSNKSKVSLTNPSLHHSDSSESRNRTVYVLRKLDENTIIVLRRLTDIYQSDNSDFDTEDFIDWDLTVG